MYYSASTSVYLDGTFIPATKAGVSPWSQTLHYGTGVLEGIRSYAARDGVHVYRSIQHMERLLKGVNGLGMKVNQTAVELNEICLELLRLNGLKSAYIRPLVLGGENVTLAGGKKCQVFMAAWPWPRLLGTKQIRTCIHEGYFALPYGILNESKISGMYASSVLATNMARARGFDEALICDENGMLLRGSATNLFVEKKGVLYTPALKKVFPGITRETVIELAGELGITIVEREIHKDELSECDSAFLCGTATEIVGIQSVDQIRLPQSWEDSAGFWIYQKYKRRVVQNEYHNYLLL